MDQDVAGPHALSNVTLYLPHPVLVPDSLCNDSFRLVLAHDVLVQLIHQLAGCPLGFHIDAQLIEDGLHQSLVKFGWVEEVSEVHVVVGPEPHLPLLGAAEVRQLEVSSEDALPTYCDFFWYLICLDRFGPL